MSESQLLAATVSELLADHCTPAAVRAARGGWHADLWRRLEESGLTLAGVDIRRGGSGGDLHDAAIVARLCGSCAAPVAVAETALVAAPALAAAGLDVMPGPLTVDVAAGEALRLYGDGSRVDGVLTAVPYGRVATAVVALARDAGGGAFVVAVAPSSGVLEQGTSPAGEPRDRLSLEGAAVLSAAAAPSWLDERWLQRRVALSRALLLAGAAERVVAMTVDYVQGREQFGRALARFQVVQHMLAEAAGEAAAARAAAIAAVDAAMGTGAIEEWSVAAAKVRAGQAAARCAAIAHQLHGAIGVTFEHALHLFTTRMQAWRDEGGTESRWALHLGRLALQAGAPATWDAITRTAG